MAVPLAPCVAFFSRHCTLLASPVSQDLHCSLGYTFAASSIALLRIACRDYDPATHRSASQTFEIWSEASMTLQSLDSMCLQVQHHEMGSKVGYSSEQ